MILEIISGLSAVSAAMLIISTLYTGITIDNDTRQIDHAANNIESIIASGHIDNSDVDFLNDLQLDKFERFYDFNVITSGLLMLRMSPNINAKKYRKNLKNLPFTERYTPLIGYGGYIGLNLTNEGGIIGMAASGIQYKPAVSVNNKINRVRPIFSIGGNLNGSYPLVKGKAVDIYVSSNLGVEYTPFQIFHNDHKKFDNFSSFINTTELMMSSGLIGNIKTHGFDIAAGLSFGFYFNFNNQRLNKIAYRNFNYKYDLITKAAFDYATKTMSKKFQSYKETNPDLYMSKLAINKAEQFVANLQETFKANSFGPSSGNIDRNIEDNMKFIGDALVSLLKSKIKVQLNGVNSKVKLNLASFIDNKIPDMIYRNTNDITKHIEKIGIDLSLNRHIYTDSEYRKYINNALYKNPIPDEIFDKFLEEIYNKNISTMITDTVKDTIDNFAIPINFKQDIFDRFKDAKFKGNAIKDIDSVEKLFVNPGSESVINNIDFQSSTYKSEIAKIFSSYSTEDIKKISLEIISDQEGQGIKNQKTTDNSNARKKPKSKGSNDDNAIVDSQYNIEDIIHDIQDKYSEKFEKSLESGFNNERYTPISPFVTFTMSVSFRL